MSVWALGSTTASMNTRLQRIVEMIQDKEMLGKLMKADAPEEMIRMIREKEKTI